MKTFFSCLLFVVAMLAASAAPIFFGQNYTAPVDGGGGGFTPPGSYVFLETFDNPSGYDGTWVTFAGSGTINPDYTTSPAPLHGTQSLRIAGVGYDTSVTYRDHSQYSEVTYVWMMRFESLPSADIGFCKITDYLGVGLIEAGIDSSGIVEISDGVASATTSTPMLQGVTYYCWLHYKDGTGSNAIADFGFVEATDGTRPTSGGRFAQFTNSTLSGQSAASVQFRAATSTSQNATILFDRLYLTTP